MKRQNVLKSLFLSLILSSLSTSCGLIEKFKTPEQPTDSKSSDTAEASKHPDSGTDDLFSKTMNDAKDEPLKASTDAPTNITTTENPVIKDDLKSLEDEFSGTTPKAVADTESKQVKVEESLPEIKSELPETVTENANNDAGKVMSYKVHKGETLMQIAFKIYGDVSKWKDLKQMNGPKLSKNSALRSNMELKYKAPAKLFVWNPEGTPYMIKTGETLGTISNSVYKSPKKWKTIWENNKPLIKNPNVIYAGFTLFYKGSGMANYVQPKAIQRKLAAKDETKIEEKTEVSRAAIEEVKVDQAISNLEHLDSANEIDLTKEVQSATIRDLNEDASKEVKAELKSDEIQDEALVH
ncbi:MAG: LysM peptidoglycan-binding domain-containing protein [Bacteriovorax sp.]|nr:LysM peptidoglycan-binding domain-containing protein [Bacteriovorax sp.]